MEEMRSGSRSESPGSAGGSCTSRPGPRKCWGELHLQAGARKCWGQLHLQAGEPEVLGGAAPPGPGVASPCWFLTGENRPEAAPGLPCASRSHQTGCVLNGEGLCEGETPPRRPGTPDCPSVKLRGRPGCGRLRPPHEVTADGGLSGPVMGRELEDLGPASGHRPPGTHRAPKHHPAITGGEGTNKHPDRLDTWAGRREGCGATGGERGAGRRAGLRGRGHSPGHRARAHTGRRRLRKARPVLEDSQQQGVGRVINRASMGRCLPPPIPTPVPGVFSLRACVSLSVSANDPSPVDGDPPR